MSRAKPAFPIIYVKYHDHCWLDAKEIKKIRDATPYIIEETGFLLHETPKYITLARERSTDGEKHRTSYDSVTIIMRSDILAMQTFGPPAGRTRKAKGKRR